MNTKFVAVAALAAALVAGPVFAESTANAPATSAPPATIEAALSHYERERYAEAFLALLKAAEEGDVAAQVMLGMMYLHGPKYYGSAVPQDLEAANHWFNLAAQAGSPVAKFFVANVVLMRQRVTSPLDNPLLMRPK